MRVVVTGAECTGKTTLAEELAAHFGAPLSREFARLYVEQQSHDLTSADVEPIGNGQLAGEDAALVRARESGAWLVLHDTDLLSTCIYASYYYGDCPAWIGSAAEMRKPSLYLLCANELSWEADGVRAEVADRAPLQERFAHAVRRSGVAFALLSGGREVRREQAIAAVAALQRR